MGIATETLIVNQSKKGQGETNDRLDALLTEQMRTNELLLWLGQVLQATSGR
jgi:hypothetical protein